jgi:predicted dehydrogenase
MQREPIRLGMVGGGIGGFIGGVHRMAARLDDRFRLVAGALSSDTERAHQSAEALGIATERSYASFEEMAASEAARPDGIEAVAIVTPNHLHVPAATAFLQAGIHVICDKPLASSLDDGLALAEVVKNSGRLFVLTHNYSGYPMARQMRDMVREGRLGKIRVVHVEYVQDWLATALEADGAKGAEWRTDPSRAGLGGAIGDIGTHAYQLLRFVSGLEVEGLQAQLSAFVPGRTLDDDAQVLLRFKGGARGTLWASQVCPGNANGLRLRIFGELGGLSWSQEDPDRLWYSELGKPSQLITRGGPQVSEHAAAASRIPAGHPEGYLEAFATLYRDAADMIETYRTTGSPDFGASLVPNITDGLEGLRFIQAAVKSARNNGQLEAL